MTGLTARASIRDRSARHCCHERKEKPKKGGLSVPSVGKANKYMRQTAANVSGWCVLFGSFGVVIGDSLVLP
jgi:hypothetical protein